jgi:hypothetical protein
MRTGRALAAAVGLLCLNAVVGGPFRQKAQATPAEPPAPVSRALAPGQCGVYKNGKAVLALCIDSAVQWGADVVQVNGFMVNNGSAAICDLLLKPVSDGKVISFWPDWAEKASYEVYYNQGQNSAVGLTAEPSGKQPWIEVSGFHDCAVAAKDAKFNDTTFALANITDFQPKATTVGAVSMHGGAPTGTGVAPAIPEGQCGLYTKGDGQLALCVESVLRWGELIQVNGFLQNVGKAKACNIKVGFSGADTYYSIWPEWVSNATWQNDYAIGQVTAVGLTAQARADGTKPSVYVDNFQACGDDFRTAPTMTLVPLSSVKAPEGAVSRRLFAWPWQHARAAQQLAANATTDANATANATAVSAPAAVVSKALAAGECGVYSLGKAAVALCIESIVQWGQDVQQVNGFLINNGSVALCDLHLKPVTDGDVYSFWPDWAEKSAYEVYFNPKQVTAVGTLAGLSSSS